MYCYFNSKVDKLNIMHIEINRNRFNTGDEAVLYLQSKSI